MPTMLSVVIIGFAWKLILSPIWGVSLAARCRRPEMALRALARQGGVRAHRALADLGLAVCRHPLMLIYAALLNIPKEVIEAADLDGVRGPSLFFKVKLPLILPSIGIISILTFIGNFNAFDLIYAAQGALGGPNFSTDILGTYLYRVSSASRSRPATTWGRPSPRSCS